MLWPKIATVGVYLAVVAAGTWLTHFTTRRLSRGAALALALLPLTFTGPALLTGRVYAPYDLAWSTLPLNGYKTEYGVGTPRGIFIDVRGSLIPWHKAVRWAWAHGDWPLWNPFASCGDPLAGSAQPAPYYPVNLAALLVPLPWALTLMAALQFWLAALGAFLYAREIDCREEAALLAAAGWACSAFIGFWIEYPLGATLSFLPLALFAAHRLARRPGARSCALLTVAFAVPALAGHPESLLHVVVVGLIGVLVEAIPAGRAAERQLHHLRSVAAWASGAALASLGLTAVFLLPVLEVLPQTLEWELRRGLQGHLHAGSPLAESLHHLGRSLLPPQDASPRDFLLPPLASAYVGSVLWAPALYGLWRGRGRERYLLLALGLFGLLTGAKAPLLTEALGRLPLLGVSLNQRFVVLAPLALACLAGLGVEAWLRAGGGKTLGLLACAVTAAVLSASVALMPGASAAGMDQGVFRILAAWWVLPLLASALALVAWRRAPRTAALALILCLVAQRAGEAGSFYPTLSAEAFYPRVAPLTDLPPSAEPYRVVGHQFSLLPNDATLWELEDPRGYQAIHHRRFAETTRLWAAPESVWWSRAGNLNAPFLSFLNVQFALTARRQRPEGWMLVRRSAGGLLWSNPRALPRAFLPESVRTGVAPAATVAEMAAETDFARRAWIEPPEPTPAASAPLETENGQGTVRIERRGTGYRLSADLRGDAWVVISETAWRGWRAFRSGRDRRELPLGIANHAFLALRLPAGAHEVDLAYRPRAFEVGLAVTGFTCLALVAVAIVYRRRRVAVEGARQQAVTGSTQPQAAFEGRGGDDVARRHR